MAIGSIALAIDVVIALEYWNDMAAAIRYWVVGVLIVAGLVTCVSLAVTVVWAKRYPRNDSPTA
jgi:hypothetical protein